jgi:hypothetical protein
MKDKIQPNWMAPAYPNNPDHRAHEYGCEGMPTLLMVAAMLMEKKHPDNERTSGDRARRASNAIADACALMEALDSRLETERTADMGRS